MPTQTNVDSDLALFYHLQGEIAYTADNIAFYHQMLTDHGDSPSLINYYTHKARIFAMRRLEARRRMARLLQRNPMWAYADQIAEGMPNG